MQTIGRPSKLDVLRANVRVARSVFSNINVIYNAPGRRRVRRGRNYNDRRKTAKVILINRVLATYDIPSRYRRAEIRDIVFRLISRYG